jgi:acetyl esterase/lipase
MARRGLSRKRLSFQAKLLGSVARATGRRALFGARHKSWTWPYELMMAVMRDAMHDDHDGSAKLMRRRSGKLPEAIAARVTIGRETLAGVACEVHTPRDHRAGDATLLYLHGGGYVTCSPATHRELIARLALSTGARCVAPDYRLAPEHPFPAALDDALAVLAALASGELGSPVQPRTLFIAGDSAGGGLALAALLKLRDQGLALPRAALLLSPWVDLSLDRAALTGHGPLDYLNARMLSETAPKYAAATGLTDPLVSPIYADLSGLPPLLLQTGGWEVFYEQNVRFVAKARAAGVEVRHEIEEGMLHVYPAFAGLLPEARRALRSTGEFVRSFALLDLALAARSSEARKQESETLS